MQRKDFILEIGTEEIPARFLEGIFSDCGLKARGLLQGKRLEFGNVEVLGTMRRIIVGISGLSDKQKDVELKIKGPSRAHAFSPDGSPTKTALAFAASKGVFPDSLLIEKVNNADYVFAVKHEKGLPAEQVLKEFVPELISSLYLPVSMKWGLADHSFIRPIHYIMSVLGGKKLLCTAAGVSSSDFTRAHRFLFDNKKEVFKGSSLEEFTRFLKKYGIIADSRDRRRVIEDRVTGAVDKGLLSETADLVENPTVLMGRYKNDFCGTIPEEVIFTVIKEQQKCFPVSGGNSFFIVADGKESPEISAGYEQVVNARLADAKFFYDEDLKMPLSQSIEKTKKITFLEKAGSVMDKTVRVKALCSFIAEKLGADKAACARVERAAELSKFDLASHLVGEFPSLAGVMGKYYALAKGEDAQTAQAVLEQYLPAYSGDKLSGSFLGAVLGVCDRADTIVSCFSAGIIPTGSEDPYALRRNAQGLVSILLGKNFRIPLSLILEKAFAAFGSGDPQLKTKTSDFIIQRLKVTLENDGAGREIAEAAMSSADIFTDTYCRAFEMKKASAQPWFKDLVMSADRVRRICPAQPGFPAADASLFIEEGERELYKIYLSAKKTYDSKTAELNFESALKTLSELSAPLAVFFEKVLVMHEDPAIKANRLALLSDIKALYEQFADFSKITN